MTIQLAIRADVHPGLFDFTATQALSFPVATTLGGQTMGEDATDVRSEAATRTPLHLWAVGVAALMWNAIAAADYVMTRMQNDDYFRAVMPGAEPSVIYAYIDAMPILAQAGWGLGVWGAVAGTLLLLARSRFALWAYLASLAGAIISFGIQYAGPAAPEGMDDGIMPIIITVIALGLFLYARAMKAKGVLR